MGNRFDSYRSFDFRDYKRDFLKMNVSDRLQIVVHLLNFIIFLYFAVILIQTDPLDVTNIIISAVGLISSLVVSILSAVERLRGE